MKTVICVDPGGNHLTKGKVYLVLREYIMTGEKWRTVINDMGEQTSYFAKRFKEDNKIDKYFFLSEKIKEIKARREKLGYQY